MPDDVALACVSLFAAWMVNDVEELLTMREDSAALLSRAPRWLPVPEVLRTHGLSQRHVNVSVAAMGVLIAAASADAVAVDTGGQDARLRVDDDEGCRGAVGQGGHAACPTRWSAQWACRVAPAPSGGALVDVRHGPARWLV